MVLELICIGLNVFFAFCVGQLSRVCVNFCKFVYFSVRKISVELVLWFGGF